MRIVTDEAQDLYWQRKGYRSFDDPVALAYALPKFSHIKRYVPLAGRRILDVGCGTGLFTHLFLQESPHVVALDYSDAMLRRNPGRVLARGRGEALPFASKSFDVVFVANLLHHVAEPSVVLQEAVRVSRRDVVLLEPNCFNPIMFGFSLLVREERGGLRSSRRFLTRLLRQEGLQVLRCSAMGMISQNQTPGVLVPLLRWGDREFALGEYLMAIGRQPGGEDGASTEQASARATRAALPGHDAAALVYGAEAFHHSV